MDAALGMYGAGGYRAQCGLVEGPLMFIGIHGKKLGLSDGAIGRICKQFAAEFEGNFSSLVCRELRPEGFHPDNPPHLCEPLTVEAIEFQYRFIVEKMAEAVQNNDEGKHSR